MEFFAEKIFSRNKNFYDMFYDTVDDNNEVLSFECNDKANFQFDYHDMVGF